MLWLNIVIFLIHSSIPLFWLLWFQLHFKWILAYMSNANLTLVWHCKPSLCFVSFQLYHYLLDAKMSLKKKNVKAKHRINLYIFFTGIRTKVWTECLLVLKGILCNMSSPRVDMSKDKYKLTIESDVEQIFASWPGFGIDFFGGKTVETCIDQGPVSTNECTDRSWKNSLFLEFSSNLFYGLF